MAATQAIFMSNTKRLLAINKDFVWSTALLPSQGTNAQTKKTPQADPIRMNDRK